MNVNDRLSPKGALPSSSEPVPSASQTKKENPAIDEVANAVFSTRQTTKKPSSFYTEVADFLDPKKERIVRETPQNTLFAQKSLQHDLIYQGSYWWSQKDGENYLTLNSIVYESHFHKTVKVLITNEGLLEWNGKKFSTLSKLEDAFNKSTLALLAEPGRDSTNSLNHTLLFKPLNNNVVKALNQVPSSAGSIGSAGHQFLENLNLHILAAETSGSVEFLSSMIDEIGVSKVLDFISKIGQSDEHVYPIVANTVFSKLMLEKLDGKQELNHSSFDFLLGALMDCQTPQEYGKLVDKYLDKIKARTEASDIAWLAMSCTTRKEGPLPYLLELANRNLIVAGQAPDYYWLNSFKYSKCLKTAPLSEEDIIFFKQQLHMTDNELIGHTQSLNFILEHIQNCVKSNSSNIDELKEIFRHLNTNDQRALVKILISHDLFLPFKTFLFNFIATDSVLGNDSDFIDQLSKYFEFGFDKTPIHPSLAALNLQTERFLYAITNNQLTDDVKNSLFYFLDITVMHDPGKVHWLEKSFNKPDEPSFQLYKNLLIEWVCKKNNFKILAQSPFLKEVFTEKLKNSSLNDVQFCRALVNIISEEDVIKLINHQYSEIKSPLLIELILDNKLSPEMLKNAFIRALAQEPIWENVKDKIPKETFKRLELLPSILADKSANLIVKFLEEADESRVEIAAKMMRVKVFQTYWDLDTPLLSEIYRKSNSRTQENLKNHISEHYHEAWQSENLMPSTCPEIALILVESALERGHIHSQSDAQKVFDRLAVFSLESSLYLHKIPETKKIELLNKIPHEFRKHLQMHSDDLINDWIIPMIATGAKDTSLKSSELQAILLADNPDLYRSILKVSPQHIIDLLQYMMENEWLKNYAGNLVMAVFDQKVPLNLDFSLIKEKLLILAKTEGYLEIPLYFGMDSQSLAEYFQSSQGGIDLPTLFLKNSLENIQTALDTAKSNLLADQYHDMMGQFDSFQEIASLIARSRSGSFQGNISRMYQNNQAFAAGQMSYGNTQLETVKTLSTKLDRGFLYLYGSSTKNFNPSGQSESFSSLRHYNPVALRTYIIGQYQAYQKYIQHTVELADKNPNEMHKKGVIVDKTTKTITFFHPKWGAEYPLTKIKYDQGELIKDTLYWEHTHPATLRKLQNLQGEIFSEVIKFPLDRNSIASVDEFREKLIEYYWVSSHLCPLARGGSQVSLNLKKVIEDVLNYKLGPTKMDVSLLDCVALSSTLPDFLEMFPHLVEHQTPHTNSNTPTSSSF